jgi:Putative threonine/serine exporter
LGEGSGDHTKEKVFSALAAQERAQRVTTLVGSHSEPASRRTSVEGGNPDLDLFVRKDVPLVDLEGSVYEGTGYDTEDESQEKQGRLLKGSTNSEARKIVKAHTRNPWSSGLRILNGSSSGLTSGQVTPVEEQDPKYYVARPTHYRGGVLSSLLKLYNAPDATGQVQRDSNGGSRTSPLQTPHETEAPLKKHTKWYKQKHHSTDTLAGLISAPAGGGAPFTKIRPGAKRTYSAGFIDSAIERLSKPRLEDEIRITVHIAETLSRQKYLVRLCRALISYGAPTHRLEEYMKMSARVLEIDGQFLYIPGCMVISFDDAATHTRRLSTMS